MAGLEGGKHLRLYSLGSLHVRSLFSLARCCFLISVGTIKETIKNVRRYK